MDTSLHAGYILHQRPWRETSLILEVFSRDHGRLGLVARGARRSTNRQRWLFQPFRRLNLAWVMRRELGTLTHVEAADGHEPPAGAAVMAGFYLNELLLRLLHRHEPHAELFDAYAAALEGIRDEAGREPALRIFEKHLLASLGYGMVLDREADSGRPLDAQRSYYYRADLGPCAAAPEGRSAVTVSGAALYALRDERLVDPAHLAQTKRLMRMLLAEHLGGRPLASRDLYRRFVKDPGQRLE
jgi:DNA repair protein RecO (recombination protein O)